MPPLRHPQQRSCPAPRCVLRASLGEAHGQYVIPASREDWVRIPIAGGSCIHANCIVASLWTDEDRQETTCTYRRERVPGTISTRCAALQCAVARERTGS